MGAGRPSLSWEAERQVSWGGHTVKQKELGWGSSAQMLLCFLEGCCGGGGGRRVRPLPVTALPSGIWTFTGRLEALVSWLPRYTHPEVSPESISCLQGLNEVMVIPEVAIWVSLHYGCIWSSHCVCVCICVYAHVCACLWVCGGGMQT